MPRSYDLVDFKVAEAEFFLQRIPECKYNHFAVQCYVSAFISSSRSVTFAMQACIKDIKGFKEWYGRKQEKLKGDPLAKFFHEFRRVNQHIGNNVVSGGSSDGIKIKYWFMPANDLKSVPELDVESACQKYFIIILSIVYDSYIEFGPFVDPKQYYTFEHFAHVGKTVEDAEEELFGIRGYTYVPNCEEAYRWQAIRDSQPGCRINHIFEKYLGKTTPEPERLPDLT